MINRRFALLALPLALALTAAGPAKRKPAAPPPPPPIGDTVKVAMVTNLGTIELELDHKHAPITTENFVRYVDLKRFDGAIFYRVMRLKWGTQPNGLIQAGLQGNPLKVLKPIAHEPTSQTGLLHKAGAISMARNAPGTAMADFSILLSELQGLDADPKSDNPELQAGFAVFGYVSSGMDVVRKIYDVPLSETKGQGVMKGQMIDVPVKIISVRRVAEAKPQTPSQP